MNPVPNFILKAKIIERAGTQYAFAREMGVHDSVVSKVIRGARDLPKKDKAAWAKYLKCSTKDLFKE